MPGSTLILGSLGASGRALSEAFRFLLILKMVPKFRQLLQGQQLNEVTPLSLSGRARLRRALRAK